ncbi:MAG: hypothetical protein R3E39_12380 [Anaerolineae bacterium]
MPTTWTIAIDWDRNSSYTDTYDNVTSRIISANWFLGMRKAWQETGTTATNATRRNTSAALSPARSDRSSPSAFSRMMARRLVPIG